MDVLGLCANVRALVEDGPLILHAVATFGVVVPQIAPVRAHVATILLNVSAVCPDIGPVGPDGLLGVGYCLAILAYVSVQQMLILGNRALTNRLLGNWDLSRPGLSNRIATCVRTPVLALPVATRLAIIVALVLPVLIGPLVPILLPVVMVSVLVPPIVVIPRIPAILSVPRVRIGSRGRLSR